MDSIFHAHIDGPEETILGLAEKVRKTGLHTTIDRVERHCVGPQSQDPEYQASYLVHNPREFGAFTTTAIEGQDDLRILHAIIHTITGVVLELEQVIGESIPGHGLVWYPDCRLELPSVSAPPSGTKPIEVHVRLEAKNPSRIILQEVIDRSHAAGVDFGGLFVLGSKTSEQQVIWSNAFYDEKYIRERVEDQRRRLEEAFGYFFTMRILVERVLRMVKVKNGYFPSARSGLDV